MPSLHVALIHNHNENRLAAIRPSIHRIVEELAATVSEHAWQVALATSPLTVLRLLRANRQHERMHRRHLRFRGSPRPRSTLLPALSTATKSLLRGDRLARYRGALIEQLLTDKHIRVWTTFLDSDAEVLMVLEDDAVFHADSLDGLIALIQRLGPTITHPIYVDIAGGFPLRKIVDSRIGAAAWPGVTEFPMPFTNTTCAYLATRSLVAAMLEHVTWDGELRSMGPDWLINELMMRCHQDEPILSFHTDPPVLSHGSLTGIYPSEIASRPLPKA